MALGEIHKARGKHASHQMHPNSLVNLKPWKKGCPSPNPSGLPRGFHPVTRYIVDMGAMSVAELDRFLTEAGGTAPINKVIAARLLMRAALPDGNGRDFDRVCDRQSGDALAKASLVLAKRMKCR